jgi:hypothetical protein
MSDHAQMLQFSYKCVHRNAAKASIKISDTCRHDIAELLLKVALNTKNQSINQS